MPATRQQLEAMFDKVRTGAVVDVDDQRYSSLNTDKGIKILCMETMMLAKAVACVGQAIFLAADSILERLDEMNVKFDALNLKMDDIVTAQQEIAGG